MADEMRGFMYSVIFILVFSTLLLSVPAGLQGSGGTAENPSVVDPSLVTDFSASENYTYSAFAHYDFYDEYAYTLGGRNWIIWHELSGSFILGAKVLWAGFLWLGEIESVRFISRAGTDRGTSLSMAEIEADAPDGQERYDLVFDVSGNPAGGFVIYWNVTEYPDPADAWDNDVLYLLHGVGIDSSGAMNIVTLLLQLLFLQLPEVPTLVNALIATPMWSAIVYLIWFLIKESLPFV